MSCAFISMRQNLLNSPVPFSLSSCLRHCRGSTFGFAEPGKLKVSFDIVRLQVRHWWVRVPSAFSSTSLSTFLISSAKRCNIRSFSLGCWESHCFEVWNGSVSISAMKCVMTPPGRLFSSGAKATSGRCQLAGNGPLFVRHWSQGEDRGIHSTIFWHCWGRCIRPCCIAL